MNQLVRTFISLAATVAGVWGAEGWASPLAPPKTRNPRETVQTFMAAMKDYRAGLRDHKQEKLARIDDAVRCLNLDGAPDFLTRRAFGREAAILLKEVFDRAVPVDLAQIPDTTGDPAQTFSPWKFPDTDIALGRIDSGERAGDFLFTKETVARAREFYEKVRRMPYLKGFEGAGFEEPWLERAMPDVMKAEIVGLAYWQWIGLLVAFVLGWSLRGLVGWIFRSLARQLSPERRPWKRRFFELAAGPAGLLAAVALLSASAFTLRLGGNALAIATPTLKILFGFATVWAGYRMADLLGEYFAARSRGVPGSLDRQAALLVSRCAKGAVVMLGLLLTLQNLGFNVVSLLAGLGIGGLAVAFAAQDTVANFFGALMIFFDRPFEVGHWVRIGAVEGIVEDIGFRSTRIRTFGDSQVTIPNREVANAYIDNLGRRDARRTLLTLGLDYATPAEAIEAFAEGVKNILLANPHTRKDNFSVAFTNFGASSLDVQVMFFLQVPDGAEELLERQNVMLEIVRLASLLGVSFAFPTQTLHVESFPGSEPKTARPMEPQRLAAAARSFASGGDASRPAGSGLFVPLRRP